MPDKTSDQYDKVVAECKEVFLKKAKDYGTSWRVLRPSSITDQIFIKAQRIRTVQEKGTQKVDEGIQAEFIAIVNYCVIALIQLELAATMEGDQIPVNTLKQQYDAKLKATKSLMEAKNHDYGEAWRDMRISSLTDMILMRILRIKKIEENEGETLVSEGIDANYYDIINYAIFAQIKLTEAHENAVDH